MFFRKLRLRNAVIEMLDDQCLFIFRQSVHRFSQLVQQLQMGNRFGYIFNICLQKVCSVIIFAVKGINRKQSVLSVQKLQIFLPFLIPIECIVVPAIGFHKAALHRNEQLVRNRTVAFLALFKFFIGQFYIYSAI